MTRRVVSLLLVAGLVLLSACGASPKVPGPVPASSSAPPPGSTNGQPTPSVSDLGSAIDQFVTDSRLWVNTRAVLVSHRGELIAERYYLSDTEERVDVFSVTKSVIATLVGIALADGKLSLDQTLGELLPRQRAAMTAETRRTTVRHLLTLSSGRTGEQVDKIDPTPPGYVTRLLKLHGKVPAGTELNYNDGDPHLLSAVLQERTGMSPLDYARGRLFGPLGIQTDPAETGALRSGGGGGHFAWLTDGDGLPGGGYGLRLTARDMVALGELYRNEGVWKGHRLVPSSFVTEATQRHAALPMADYGYGFLWWVTPFAGLDAYSAVGYGGQIILVVPAKDLTVVVSTRVFDRSPDPTEQLSMVEHLVLPRLP